MSTLANTTWIFSMQGQLAGEIFFQQNGSSTHAGVATITATNPPIGYQGPVIWTAAWAEASDSNNFAVQLNDFMNDPTFYPPPLGIPEIMSDQNAAMFVTFFGTHASGFASVFGTNFQTIDTSGDVVQFFTMTRKPNPSS